MPRAKTKPAAQTKTRRWSVTITMENPLRSFTFEQVHPATFTAADVANRFAERARRLFGKNDLAHPAWKVTVAPVDDDQGNATAQR